jgi:hypothetical protein
MKSKVDTNNESYFTRNGGWLRPLVAGLILLLAPALVASFGQPLPFPEWLPKIAAAFAFAVSGIYAVFCETFSALIVRAAAQVLAITMLMWAIFF